MGMILDWSVNPALAEILVTGYWMLDGRFPMGRFAKRCKMLVEGERKSLPAAGRPLLREYLSKRSADYGLSELPITGY